MVVDYMEYLDNRGEVELIILIISEKLRLVLLVNICN